MRFIYLFIFWRGGGGAEEKGNRQGFRLAGRMSARWRSFSVSLLMLYIWGPGSRAGAGGGGLADVWSGRPQPLLLTCQRCIRL